MQYLKVLSDVGLSYCIVLLHGQILNVLRYFLFV